jgi:Peptidase family M23
MVVFIFCNFGIKFHFYKNAILFLLFITIFAISSLHIPMNKSIYYFSILLLSICSLSYAQPQPTAIPKGYLVCPIMPGQRNFLSGSFADLRSNHFHAGLDFKTQQREGLPVYASAEGYVYKIKVLTKGYGNALFVKHPNGLITVYGHLQRFNDAITKYLRKKQYEQQTFEIDLQLQPNELPIKQLEIIGLSGNSGGSGGPHLHYEVRSADQLLENPFKAGFGEVPDTTPPTFEQIALVPLNINSRINGEFARKVFTVVKQNNSYVVPQPIECIGEIGIELAAHDRIDGSGNKHGLPSVEIQMDGEKVYYHHFDQIPNDISRDLNVFLNYEAAKQGSTNFQRCYIANGNRLPIYENTISQGRIHTISGKLHQLTIKAYDALDNASYLNFTLVGSDPTAPIASVQPSTLPTQISTDITRNTLTIKAKYIPTAQPMAIVWVKGKQVEMPISYAKGNESVFLWDLRNGIPDSVVVERVSNKLGINTVIYPNIAQTYNSNDFSILTNSTSLYDTLYISTNILPNGIQVGESTIPLKDYLTVKFSPKQGINDLSHTHIYLNRTWIGGTWQDGQLSFRTRELGTFQLLTDSQAPTVRLIKKSAEGFSFNISDNLSGIQNWKATVNGEWVLMSYDFKKNLLWSEKLDPSHPFEGTLRLEVQDRAGNVTVVSYIIN